MIQGTLQNFIKIFKDHAEADTDLQYFAYGEVFLVEDIISMMKANEFMCQRDDFHNQYRFVRREKRY
jgi:hypothetical protein